MTDTNTEPADDWWKPDADDPFWMLEASDGEWLKNEQSLMGTREAAKALRFPSAQSAMNTRARWASGSKWWDAKPTEHLWRNMPSTPPAPDAGEREAETVEALAVHLWNLDTDCNSDASMFINDAERIIALLAPYHATERTPEYARGLADGVMQSEAAIVAFGLREVAQWRSDGYPDHGTGLADFIGRLQFREHAQEAGNER